MTEQIVVIPDMHIPYHDGRVWECILEVIRRTKPSGIVVIGDFSDFYSVSSHAKDPRRKIDFDDEVAATKRERARLEKAAGKAWLHFCRGNHETRLDRYIVDNAPQLHSSINSRELLGFSDSWGWTEYGDWFSYGKCNFTHDVGRTGVNTARQSLVDFGGNIVVGHSHRLGVSYQGTTRGEVHFGLNVGFGGDFAMIDYYHRAKALRDWQHGFGVVSFDSFGYCWAQAVPILRGRAVVGKIQVSGRK